MEMLLTKDDFVVGQVVACKHVGNRSRYDKGMTLGKVTRVGKKYVTVSFKEDQKGIMFVLEESFERDYLLQKTNYSGDYEMFPSEKSYLEYEEKQVKLSEIRTAAGDFYSQSKLTIDQVRRIHDIVNE